jgi:hypothetical protein
MIERKDPEFKQFAEGDVLTGVLVSIETIQIKDRETGQPKSCARYTVEEIESGEMVCFLGAYQIDSKLRSGDIGHIIEVRHLGKDDSVKRNGNPMTRYKVLVSDKAAPGWTHSGSRVTDEDLPEILR